MNRSTTKISVVIPTILRPELSRAISSVRKQKQVHNLEVIVVVDADPSREIGALTDGADIVLSTGGGKRGGYARNMGTDAASGQYVAYLDDDDWWHPEKIDRQLKILAQMRRDGDYVIGTRVRQVLGDDTTKGKGSPARLIGADDAVEDYLFRNRPPSIARPSFFTSTILAPRTMLSKVRWDESLTRHQDWDLLIRLQNAGAQFIQAAEELVFYSSGSRDSISATVDWEASLKWARSWKGTWRDQTYVDFVVAQPLRYAIQSRSAEGFRRALAEIYESRRLANILPTLFAIGALVPRSVILRTALRGRFTESEKPRKW